MGDMQDLLNPEKALIFRIVHRDNLRWLLENGLHCRNSDRTDPNFVSIGNLDLISSRHSHPVSVPPGGSLSDYVPFYFTPLSVMLFNINTGYHGIRQRRNEEIVILVSSLHKLQEDNIHFIFTDRHARLASARVFTDISDMNQIDWKILQNRDFRRDIDDLEKIERYQAEALVHRRLPINSLLGVACYNTSECDKANKLADGAGLSLRIVSRPGWYF
jgi:hypothetical protein